jgi:hypothetical protein
MNVSGIVPIPFSNNSDLNEVRGHSDYERIVPDLKNYHDVFPTHVGVFPDVDVAKLDLMILVGQDDEANFIFPAAEATSAYNEALKTSWKKIAQGSACPEIVWGLKTTGNSNSAEESMSTLLNYVRSKQDQKTTKYFDLFSSCLKILSIAEMTRYDMDIKVEWGKLDGISMETKAKILASFSSGMAAIVDSASGSKEQLYKIWNQFYPEETEDTVAEYITGINQMAKHKSLKDASFIDIKDANSGVVTDDEGVDLSKMPE